MDGTLTVTSEVGRGSTFMVSLRQVAVAAVEALEDVDAGPSIAGIVFEPARVLHDL